MIKNLTKLTLCVILLIGISACSNNDDQPTGVVSQYIDKLVDGDMKGASEVSGETFDEKAHNESSLAIDGVMDIMFSHITYNVKKENIIDDTTATVDVEISNYKYPDILFKTQELCSKDESLNNVSNEVYYEAFVKYANQTIKDMKLSKRTIEVKLSKEKDKWVIISDNLDFQQALIGI